MGFDQKCSHTEHTRLPMYCDKYGLSYTPKEENILSLNFVQYVVSDQSLFRSWLRFRTGVSYDKVPRHCSDAANQF